MRPPQLCVSGRDFHLWAVFPLISIHPSILRSLAAAAAGAHSLGSFSRALSTFGRVSRAQSQRLTTLAKRALTRRQRSTLSALGASAAAAWVCLLIFASLKRCPAAWFANPLASFSCFEAPIWMMEPK